MSLLTVTVGISFQSCLYVTTIHPVNCKNVSSFSNVDKQWIVFKNNNNSTVTGIVSSVSSKHTYHREIICLVSQSYNICLFMHLTAAVDWRKRSGEPQNFIKNKIKPKQLQDNFESKGTFNIGSLVHQQNPWANHMVLQAHHAVLTCGFQRKQSLLVKLALVGWGLKWTLFYFIVFVQLLGAQWKCKLCIKMQGT